MDSNENLSRFIMATDNTDANLKIVDQTVSETTIMLVVRNGNYKRVLQSIYKEFF